MGTGKWLGDRLLIHDYQNAKQVLNAMVLQDKTQNKKIICYLNKQNFCVSYMDVGRQNNKWENNLLDGESGTTPLLKGVSKHSSIDNVDEQCESMSLHFDKR